MISMKSGRKSPMSPYPLDRKKKSENIDYFMQNYNTDMPTTPVKKDRYSSMKSNHTFTRKNEPTKNTL